VAPTVTFKLVYAFVFLLHERRRVVRFAATTSMAGARPESAPARGLGPHISAGRCANPRR
jgi:hypothetical protein